eukprot:6345384-Amphidinium_carterae.1
MVRHSAVFRSNDISFGLCSDSCCWLGLFAFANAAVSRAWALVLYWYSCRSCYRYDVALPIVKDQWPRFCLSKMVLLVSRWPLSIV